MVLDAGPNDTDVRGDRQTLWEGLGLQQVYTKLRRLVASRILIHNAHAHTHTHTHIQTDRILQSEDI
jgi:hypothetical protein